MICTSCGSMEPPKRPPHGARCSHCGSADMKHETREAMMLAAEAIAIARVRELVAGWANEGLIARPSAEEIQRRLTPPPPEPLELPPPPEPQPPPDVKTPPQWVYPQHEYRPEQIDQHVPDLPPAIGGLDAIAPLAALDAAPPTPRAPGKWETEVRPLLYENIGWFLGTLLVLAGSVYGVREAWRTLGGVARHVAVGGALFAYHAGFVGLAALLSKKSKGTGAVLGAIALGLSPIVFVALSSMVEVDFAVGSLLALPFVIGTAFTLRSVGKRFDLENAWILPMALMPSLVAELPVGRSDPDSLARAALPFVGVVSARLALRGGSRAVDIAATYAAIALGLYAVVGGPTAAATGPLTAAAVPLFCAALAAVVASGVERAAVRSAFPRATATTTVLALSVVLVSLLVATKHATGAAPRLALLADAATALLACGTFLVVAAGRPAALHVAAIVAPLAGWLAARAAFPAIPQWWPFGTAVAAAIAIALPQGDRERRVLGGWAVVAAFFALGCAPVMESVARVRGHYVATFATAAVIAVASHGAGGVRRRGLHYLGGLAVISAALAWTLPVADDIGPTIIRVGLALAGGFAAAGLAFDLRAAVLDDDAASRSRPFEDLSAFALLIALIAALPALRMATPFALDRGATPAVTLRESTMLAVVGGAFVLRAMRDRSSFTSLFGASIVGLWIYLAAGPRSAATSALTFGAIALAAAVAASLRGFAQPDEKLSARRVFGVIPLPFPARGLRAVTDGLAHASWVATAMTILSMIGWLTSRAEADRTFAIQAGVCLVIVQVLGLFAGPFTSHGLRGSVTSLSMIVTLIGFTAVVNRIGRPLPPPVVAYKLSAVAVAMWGVALGAKRWGPGIGGALGDRPSGERYHVVFHVVVFLLATVLCVDALLLTGGRTHIALSTIPPLLLLGPAVVLVLEARTLKTKELVHVAGPLAIAGAALMATQRSILGSAPARIFPPEIAWSRGILGVAVCGTILGAATFLGRDREEAQPLSFWTLGVAFAVLASSWLRVDPIPPVLVLASGALLALGKRRQVAQAAMFVGGFLIVHAAAQATGTVPSWAGPAMAALAGAAWIASAVRRRESWLGDLLFAAATIASLLYAFAEGAVTSPIAAGPAVVRAAIGSLDGSFMRLRAIPMAAGIAGASLTITAFRTGKARVAMASFAGALLLGLAVATAASVVSPPTSFPVRPVGPAIALAFALVAAFQQGVGSALDAGERSSLGARIGRDVMLALVFTMGALFVFSPAPIAPAKSALLLGFGGLAVAAGTATVAAFRERSGRHVYYVQLAILAAYALVRTELATAVPPEGDALFGLCLGFLLLGVTVHARRAGIPEVAAAVRTFIALLPIGIALILPRRASDSAALIAAASGALYGALAWLERSRLFGSLGAAACNVALLLLALSHGFDGGEVYLAAFGLFVLALGHLFAEAMDHGARLAIRVVGGLFLYAPAAVRLTAQIASSPNGAYAIGFGAACLFGVVLGMLLQIRAYLAFGTGFLVLDVIANLTAAGIRDHRIGFLVLSLAGLSILGTMVFVTLQRELVRSWGRSLRLALRGWD
jgi:hypothetical protein